MNNSRCFRPRIWNLEKFPKFEKMEFSSETPTLPYFVLINLSFLPNSWSFVGQLSKPRQESLIVGSQAYSKGEKSHKNLLKNEKMGFEGNSNFL